MLPTVEVTMMWKGAILDVDCLHENGSISIGKGKNATFQVAAENTPSFFILLFWKKEKIILNIPSFVNAIREKEKLAGNQIEIKPNDFIVLQIGELVFQIRSLLKTMPIVNAALWKPDKTYAATLLVLSVFQIAFLAWVFLMPSKKDSEEEFLKNVEVFREVIIKNQIKHKVTVVPLAGKQGAKHKGKEGLLGKKELPKEDKLASKKGAPVLDKNQIQESQKQAMNLLNKLGLKAQKQKSNILGPGGIGSGLNEALGGLRGSQAGTAGGNNGLGTRGETEGGGGKALGIGAIGAGLSRGSGIGGVGFGRSDKAQTRIEPGTILYEGSLSKEEIQRVVEQFMAQIKYCYEKEFQKDPSLEGKLLANWIIAAEGNVNVSKMIQNTMNNQKVENCVLRVINRMVFPKPRGGGIVKVNYPFLFSSAGA